MDARGNAWMWERFTKMSNEELIEFARNHKKNADGFASNLNGQMPPGVDLDRFVVSEMQLCGLVYAYTHHNRPEITKQIAQVI